MCFAGAAQGPDQTRQFIAAYNDDCVFGAAHIAVLRRHEVLLVPGYFSDLQPAYFAEHLRWLAAVGVDHERVALRSGQSVAVNAPIVAAAIRDSARPVVLITHSKGSVDTLEALRSEPPLRDKVKAWVSLQGAFLGSPIADILLDGSVLDPAVSAAILGFLGGSMESAQGLTTTVSRKHYRDHAPAISEVMRKVPTVAFASALDGTPGARVETLLEIPRDLMWRKGIRSDGLVPTEAAVLPGMNFVKIAGVDHIAPVMPALTRFDRVRMTKALLLLALDAQVRGLPRDAGCKGKP